MAQLALQDDCEAGSIPAVKARGGLGSIRSSFPGRQGKVARASFDAAPSLL